MVGRWAGRTLSGIYGCLVERDGSESSSKSVVVPQCSGQRDAVKERERERERGFGVSISLAPSFRQRCVHIDLQTLVNLSRSDRTDNNELFTESVVESTKRKEICVFLARFPHVDEFVSRESFFFFCFLFSG